MIRKFDHQGRPRDVRPPWYAFIMPWEVPKWPRKGAWKRRHQRIARLEIKLGIADESHGLRADENIGYYHCGESCVGW